MSAKQRKIDIFFYADYNLAPILRLAEQLRHRPCACDESQLPKAGAFNWVIFLEFDDGIEWVFRAPMSRYGAVKGVAGRLLASEAATLKYVREHTSIPVPEVFHYSSSYENDIGIPYILMSKAAGRPLATFDWRTHSHELPLVKSPTNPTRAMAEEEKKKIMQQLGCYAYQLFNLRFPVIGSLFEGSKGYYYVDECLSPGHVLQDREAIEGIPRGPFHHEADYYSSLVSALLLHAEQLPMEHHIFLAPIPVPQEYPNFAKYRTATSLWNDFAALGGKVESSKNRLQYSLAGYLLRDIIPQLTSPVSQAALGFPLYHHDISTQNLFVDNDLNITCIIDWASCSTVPPAQLLATPGLPHPRDLVSDPCLTSAFRSGFEGENKITGGCVIESDSWKIGKMLSHFMRLVNLDALQDYHHLEALYGLAFGPTTHLDDSDDTNSLRAMLAAQATTQEALALADVLAADDEPESEIRRREKEYFDAVGAKQLALARKLTLAAEMNPRFVADARLWRWVDAVMEYYEGATLDDRARVQS